jgi:hypothetical protein
LLGILGTLGPATPFGSNQDGVDLPVSGGLSTGSGKPGGISFRLGASGTHGSQGNDSNEVARIDVNGYKLPAGVQVREVIFGAARVRSVLH